VAIEDVLDPAELSAEKVADRVAKGKDSDGCKSDVLIKELDDQQRADEEKDNPFARELFFLLVPFEMIQEEAEKRKPNAFAEKAGKDTDDYPQEKGERAEEIKVEKQENYDPHKSMKNLPSDLFVG
jgi:hypothetical protein